MYCVLYCKLGLLHNPIHKNPKDLNLFRYCLTLKWKCSGAPSCINHICWRWRNGTSSSKFQRSFRRKRRYCSPFKLCGRKCCPTWQSPTIPTQTLNGKDCWCRACFTSLGLTAVHMWQLWKLKMRWRINPDSSVNKTLFKNWRSRALCCCICWQKVNNYWRHEKQWWHATKKLLEARKWENTRGPQKLEARK